MSVIKAGTTLTTAYTVEADTTGALEFKTGPSATLAMSISASGVVTFPATTGFDIASANITNLTSRSLTVSAATYLATASGVVGIGTTNPSATVGIVDGANNANGQLRLSSAGSFGTRMTFVSTSTNGRTYQIGSNFVDGNGEFAIYDATASVSRFLINASGNVGIGITNPTYKLEIQDTAPRVTLRGTNNGSNVGYRLDTKDSGGTTRIGGYYYQPQTGTNESYLGLSADDSAYQLGVKANGNVFLLGGVTNASGTGITFPATQNASSNANCLDDYEEGTWTPVINATSITNLSYNTQVGNYIKIGTLVYLFMDLTWSSTASSGNGKVTGLPFVPKSQSYNMMAFRSYSGMGGISASQIAAGYVEQGVSEYVLQIIDQVTGDETGATLKSTGGRLNGWVVYRSEN